MHILPASAEAIQEAIRILRRGGIVAHATETCYGLACDLANPDAVARLFLVKERHLLQPVSGLFSSVGQARQYTEWTAEADVLAAKHLPGPLTIILPLKTTGAPHTLFTNVPPPESRAPHHAERRTIGVRISSHPLAQELINSYGRPLSTTSANLHGQPNPYSTEEVVRQFDGRRLQPDLIIDSGPLPGTPPSTVVDLSGGSPQTLRSGPLHVAP
ncbi:MAG: tRNA threonylcarbamoyladenosine biosynthesis protein [Candidatus Peregrinibacteria bacterium Greene0416_19]|nr:MAG: tRNA threonylcarbamoyladenosine biosynthesis protein [Candidatus Peregrinibacteria bacterium Greene0416_19]